jgi:hypothetical protein
MKNLRLLAVIVVVILAGSVVCWLFWPVSPASVEPVVTLQPAPSLPAAAQPPVAQISPANEVSPVQSGSAEAEATPELVTEPVTESAADEHGHDRDSQAVAPSAETINAIREIRKPVAGEGQVTQLPDGSSRLNLGNSARSVPVATIGKDGKVHVEYHGEKYLQEPDAEVKKTEVQKQETQQP